MSLANVRAIKIWGDFLTIEDRVALDKVALKAPQTASLAADDTREIAGRGQLRLTSFVHRPAARDQLRAPRGVRAFPLPQRQT